MCFLPRISRIKSNYTKIKKINYKIRANSCQIRVIRGKCFYSPLGKI